MRHLANQEVPMQVHDVMTTALVVAFHDVGDALGRSG
jgi:hypothetical protein